jgi:hypothetical protein
MPYVKRNHKIKYKSIEKGIILFRALNKFAITEEQNNLLLIEIQQHIEREIIRMKWEKDLQAKRDDNDKFDLGEGDLPTGNLGGGHEGSPWCTATQGVGSGGHHCDEGFELSFDFFGLLKWLALRLSIIMN